LCLGHLATVVDGSDRRSAARQSLGVAARLALAVSQRSASTLPGATLDSPTARVRVRQSLARALLGALGRALQEELMRDRTVFVSLILVGLVATAGPRLAEAQRTRVDPRPWVQRRASAEFEMLVGTAPAFREEHARQRAAQGIPALERSRQRREWLQVGGFLTAVTSLGTLAVGAATGHVDVAGPIGFLQFWSGVGGTAAGGIAADRVTQKLQLAEDAAVRATLKATWPTLLHTSREIFKEAELHPADHAADHAAQPAAQP